MENNISKHDEQLKPDLCFVTRYMNYAWDQDNSWYPEQESKIMFIQKKSAWHVNSSIVSIGQGYTMQCAGTKFYSFIEYL